MQGDCKSLCTHCVQRAMSQLDLIACHNSRASHDRDYRIGSNRLAAVKQLVKRSGVPAQLADRALARAAVVVCSAFLRCMHRSGGWAQAGNPCYWACLL